MVHPAPHGDLQQAVVEAGVDLAPIYAFGQLYPPPEVPVVTLPRVVLGRFGLALALPVDDPSRIARCPRRFASLRRVRSVSPGRRPSRMCRWSAPRRSRGFCALPPGCRPPTYARIRAISLMVSMPPEGVPCSGHLHSFWPVLATATDSTPSTGLRILQILGYRRPHPARRAPGHEDRPALHLARLVPYASPSSTTSPRFTNSQLSVPALQRSTS